MSVKTEKRKSEKIGKGGGGDGGGDGNSGDESGSGGKFDWDTYLTETGAKALDKEYFWQADEPPQNRFEIGQKLEAVDPRNNTITGVATVIQTFGPKIKVRFDGAGSTNDFYTLIDSPTIYPFGHTEKQGKFLQPPVGYEKNPTRYKATVIDPVKESGNLAPENCFVSVPAKPVKSLLKEQKFMENCLEAKLEVIDGRNNPTAVYPATIKGRTGDMILIEYDGWNQREKIRYDSRDLYPCGWWKKAGIDVTIPPETPKKKKARGRPPLNRTSTTPPSANKAASVDNGSVASEPMKNIFDVVLAKRTTAPTTDVPVAAGIEGVSKNVTSASEQLVDASVPQKKHQARKSIVDRTVTNRTPVDAGTPETTVAGPSKEMKPAAPSKETKPAAPSKETKTAAPSKSSVKATEIVMGSVDLVKDIPNPDRVFSVAMNGSNGGIPCTVRFNEGCNLGAYLLGKRLKTQLANNQAEGTKNMLVTVQLRDVFQAMVNSARVGMGMHVFNAIPITYDNKSEDGPTVTYLDKDGNLLARKIPIQTTLASASKALTAVLKLLKACKKLITLDNTGCDGGCSASDGSNAKKSKISGDKTTGGTSTQASNSNSGDGKEKPLEVEVAGNTDADHWWNGQNPGQWDVATVTRFITSVVGSDIADMFKEQDIDGPALILLTPKELTTLLDIRVGPAIKISNAIERLKGTNRPDYTTTPPDAQGSSDQSGSWVKEVKLTRVQN